jgi:predicted transcriptional regulator of viral defense system
MESDHPSHTEKVLELARGKGVLSASEVSAHGIPRIYLTRLVERGLLVKTGRGLYVPADADISEHHTLVEAFRRVPGGVICLLSALIFHEMTSQLPHQVWIAIDKHAWRPQVDYPRLRIVLMSGEPLAAGVVEHIVEGVAIRVFNPAKTVADCFRFRNKIGVDVAVEALRGYHRDRRGTMDELMKFARVDRVDKVMQPYMESLA